MVAENAFLDAVAAFLRSELALAADAVGVAEPVEAGELPAVVLALDEVRRGRDGLGSGLPPGPERVRLSGVLRVDVWGAAAADAAGLGAGVVEALLSPAALAEIERLVALDLVQLGSVEAQAPGTPGRRRAARFRFDFEQAVAPIQPEEGLLKTVDVHVADLPKAKKSEKPFQIGEQQEA
jgi:hypothetical protein